MNVADGKCVALRFFCIALVSPIHQLLLSIAYASRSNVRRLVFQCNPKSGRAPGALLRRNVRTPPHARPSLTLHRKQAGIATVSSAWSEDTVVQAFAQVSVAAAAAYGA